MLRHFRAKHEKPAPSVQAAVESQGEGNRKERIDEVLVSMIVKDSQPFSIVDDDGFKYLVSILDPTYILPSRQTLKKMVDTKFTEEKEKAKEEVLRATGISLTSDMWTTVHMDSYLAVTCHFVDSQDKLSTVLLGVGQFSGSSTAANIAAVKTALMEEWGIRSKIRCLVTDAAANMIACANILQVRHTICIAHALNLVVIKAIDFPGFDEIRGRARKIVAYFRSSTVAKERLGTFQQQMGKPAHKLLQEVDTRWNSTYDMLARLYEQREPVGAALVSLMTDLPPLSSTEYQSMSECLCVLSPLKEATVELSAEKTVSGSKVIPLIRMLRHVITTNQQEVTDDKAAQLCTNLLGLMSERLCHYETASQMTLATLLDPRFKTMGFCNPSYAQNAVKRLTAECAAKVRDTAAPNTTPEPAESSSAAADNPGTGLWDLLDQRVMETRKVKSATANATVEVQRYLSEPNITRSEDPLQFWAQHKHIYPHLYMLSLCYLCTPASSVPCEQVFSKAGEVVSKKRNRLSPSTVEKILFLNKNQTT